MKSRAELHRLKLERLQKEEAFFDKLHLIHVETTQCIPCLTPLDTSGATTLMVSSGSTQEQQEVQEQQLQFLNQLSNQTDLTQHYPPRPSLLPPLASATLPSGSLKYFRRLKKKEEVKDIEEKIMKIESSEDQEIIRRDNTSTCIVQEKALVEVKEETEEEKKLRHKIRRAESTAVATLPIQQRGYGTKKLNLSTSTSIVIPSDTQQIPVGTSSESCPSSYYTPPLWLSMPQLSHLSDSIQSNKRVSLDLVSHVPTLRFIQSKYLLVNPVFTIGTSPTCDCVVAVDSILSKDLQTQDRRHIRHISPIHCVLYTTSLLSEEYLHDIPFQRISSTALLPPTPSSPSTHSPSKRELFRSHANTTTSTPSVNVTAVDNHSLWGSYVVSMNGVSKISTTIPKASTLHSGDLLCLGLVRNGPKTMSPVEANKAMIVFRVRIE